MPGEAGLAYDALDAYGTLIEGGFDHSEDPDPRKAYLRILLFDKTLTLWMASTNSWMELPSRSTM